jgi:hypothetical protein
MDKTFQKLEIIVNFIKDILYPKKIIVFIGRRGIKIGDYNKGKVRDSIFIDHNNPDKITLYKDFLTKRANFQVVFLLDSEECGLKHEFIPMFQSIIKSNPVEKFLEENYKAEDIIAYNVYNIDHTNGEVWETTVASAPYSHNINQLVEFVIYNSFRLGGVYFLSMEFEPIIDKILEQKNLSDCGEDFQIFTVITEASNIRVATKYQKNILDESITEFPSDKSDLYIVGTIEQIITDIVLKYKGYIKTMDSKVCLIFACDPVLYALLAESKLFKDYKIVNYYADPHEGDKVSINPVATIPPDSLPSGEDSPQPHYHNSSSHFQDDTLLELCVHTRKYQALNKLLRSIGKLTIINSIVFKPLFVIVIIIGSVLASFKYRAYTIQTETIELNNKYYLLSEKYRNIQKRHPDVENIANLADLYNFQTILRLVSPTPFKALEEIFSIKRPNIEVVNIVWFAQGANILDKKALIAIDVIYENSKKDKQLLEQSLNDYVNDMKNGFSRV